MKSSLEEELAMQLRAAGIAFEREFRFCPWRKFRADFVIKARSPFQVGDIEGFPTWGGVPMTNLVLVEVQGGGFVNGGHSRGMGLERDCEKMATAAALGWRVLPVTGRQIKNGTALALIEAALGLKPLEAPKVEPKPRRSKRIPGRHKGKGLPERVKRAAGL